MKLPVVLFDADGVLTLPEEVFSVVYARSHGLDPEPFEHFFRNDWKQIVTGKKDLKESIAENPGLWQWQGDIEDLLDYWFRTEDIRNDALIRLIQDIKNRGVPCYLATEQEKYRGEYMKNVMFKDLFDGYFVTAELGVSKTEPSFFEIIIEELKAEYPGIKPKDIIFFDDSQSKVDTAISVGIDGRLYTGVGQVKAFADKLSFDTKPMEDIIKSLVLKLGASCGAIMVVDESEKLLRCAASYNMPTEWDSLVNKLEDTPDKNRNGRVAVTGIAEIANHIDIDFHGYPISSIIVVPVKKSGRVVANIEIITDDPGVTFSKQDQDILEQAAKEELLSLV